jgi:hypothetical protein
MKMYVETEKKCLLHGCRNLITGHQRIGRIVERGRKRDKIMVTKITVS